MLIYGKQSVYYLIDHHPERITQLYLAKELDKKEYSRLMRMGFEIKRIPVNAAQVMCKSGNHQGFLADVEPVELRPLGSVRDGEFVVLLNGITDVGNIGAIVRSAYALGVDAVIVCGIKDLKLEPIARSSSGALFDMPIVVVHNVHDVLNELGQMEYTLYGAAMDGEDIRQIACSGKKALVLGNEGEGITARVASKLDRKVRIEMSHGFDSLNVSVAGAILMDRMR